MTGTIKVSIFGATGRTGSTIVNGLLASDTNFEITALTRASRLNSDSTNALRERGVRIAKVNVNGPRKDLVNVLNGTDVLISAVIHSAIHEEIPLIEAAKEAGVKRWVPSFWSTPAPRDIMMLRDLKLAGLDHARRLYLPYTVIDVGWWSQQWVPKLPSGRTNHAAFLLMTFIPGKGNVRIATVDMRDIGRLVARIIVDPRTLNKFVYAYTEAKTLNEIIDLLKSVSGEDPALPRVSAEKIHSDLKAAQEALKANPADESAGMAVVLNQYFHSWALRGDASPESAAYLGYIETKTLYPDFEGTTIEQVFRDVLNGNPSGYWAPTSYSIKVRRDWAPTSYCMKVSDNSCLQDIHDQNRIIT
ncbi:hypothetical protein ACHAQA_009860 [Verticillium albo-atrum]